MISAGSVAAHQQQILPVVLQSRRQNGSLERDCLALTLRGCTRSQLSCLSSSRRLVSASQDNTIKVWDVSTGEELLTFRAELVGMSVRNAAFSPDGWSIAAGVGDRVRIWN